MLQELTNKRLARAKQAKDEGKGARKVKAWPSELVFFIRAVELLQGICSSTGHLVSLDWRSALHMHTP